MGREVDEEGPGIGTEDPAAGRTGDEVAADTGPSSETGGPTPHPAAMGPVSSDAGTRGRFARGFGPGMVLAFRLLALV